MARFRRPISTLLDTSGANAEIPGGERGERGEAGGRPDGWFRHLSRGRNRRHG